MLLAPGVRGVLVLLVDDFVPAWSQQRINILILHNIGKASSFNAIYVFAGTYWCRYTHVQACSSKDIN